MGVEVVIPGLRPRQVEMLVRSLSLQTVSPDTITVVSNEILPFEAATRTRLLRFTSEEYGVGDFDVALRQNVGIFAAEAEIVIIQGDDQIAPPTMVEDSLWTLGDKDYIWGNHRLLDFSQMTFEEIRLSHRDTGRSRENPVPPAMHGYYSCYGGMLVARTGFLREVGAFDMAFNGRHGSEDQQLGYRLMRMAHETKVMIHEPPFSWHPIELKEGDTRSRAPWLEPLTNGCGQLHHDFSESFVNGVRFLQCRNCPVRRFSDELSKLFTGDIVIPYRPEAVVTTSDWL
jgi:hypothetical protein